MVHLPPIILIVEADLVARTAMSNALERHMFAVVSKASAEDALKFIDTALESQRPNVIVLGSKLGGFSSVEACTILKTKSSVSHVPIILFADREEDVAGLKGLENIFDDYLVRPFDSGYFISKIKAVLMRSKPALRKKVISFGDMSMDLMSYRVIKNGREVHLGPTEFRILQCLIEEPTKIYSREELMLIVWGNNNVELRTVDVHINRLRAALSEPGRIESTIKTVRSAGYCLELPQYVN